MTSAADCIATLEGALSELPPGPLLLACSGGMDSSALLHALAGSDHARARGLRALHIDHGLHTDSARWSQHCEALAERLQVPLSVIAVEVAPRDTDGPEAAARRARYGAIRSHMRSGEIVLTAHHANDQAETVLLRLLRGGGPRGLGAMRPLRAFGTGFLARPWLALERIAIETYASTHGLNWIDDPSNAQQRFTRNFLRTQILPLLAQRWPHWARAIGRSAALSAGAADRLDADVRTHLALAQGLDPATIRIEVLMPLSMDLRHDVLRAWFIGLRLPPPGAVDLRQIERDVLRARVDGTPRVSWVGAELRRHRDLLYALAPLPAIGTGWSLPWDGIAPITLPRGFGQLRLDPGATINLRVKPRAGGERIHLADNRPSQSVKHALQNLGVAPWVRARTPLLWLDDELWAVGDLILSLQAQEWLNAGATTLRWRATRS